MAADTGWPFDGLDTEELLFCVRRHIESLRTRIANTDTTIAMRAALAGELARFESIAAKLKARV